MPPADRLVIAWPLKMAGGLLAVIIVAAIAFAVFEPIQVLPRIRPAPGYALTDSEGRMVTSEDVRGSITLYSFAPVGCRSECDDLYTTMSDVGRRVGAEVELGEVPFRQITIALDSNPAPDDMAQAATASGADGERWRWVGGEELRVRTVVGSGFRRFYEPDTSDDSIRFDPGFVLVDGAGVIRGEYRYQTLASDADKLVHHIDILATEIRNADGATAVAYEAAHLFLCYP